MESFLPASRTELVETQRRSISVTNVEPSEYNKDNDVKPAVKTVVKAEVKLIHAQKHAIAGGQARDLLRQKLDFTMDVQFENLGLKLRSNGLQVLRGVTGRCASGRITAIMGPSGAGKVGCQVRASVCVARVNARARVLCVPLPRVARRLRS